MMVTIELLRKLKACEQGIKYVERFYPNGAEVITLIRDRHINKEFLHWGREHLTITEEELAAYCEVCDIVNSEGYWQSQNIQDSQYVVRSKQVTKSRSVFDSSDIIESTDIVHSESVNQSSQIFYSFAIEEAQRIYKGENITASSNICNSKLVVRSKNVIDSAMVFDSSEIIKSTNVSESHFCQDCKDIKHCLFCMGLEGAEYHIFNKPVDKNMYELFAQQYFKYLLEDLSFIREWPSDLVVSTFNAPTRKFDDWYHPISPKFWKWARTLPNFDSMLMYNITMLPEILVD